MTGDLVELLRDAVLTGLLVLAPVLAVGFGVGTLAGLVQAAPACMNHSSASSHGSWQWRRRSS